MINTFSVSKDFAPYAYQSTSSSNSLVIIVGHSMDNSRKSLRVGKTMRSFTSLKKLLNEQNSFSICSLSSVFVAIPIRPHNCMLLRVFHSPLLTFPDIRPKLKPNLVSSSAMCSCNRQLTTFPTFAALFIDFYKEFV